MATVEQVQQAESWTAVRTPRLRRSTRDDFGVRVRIPVEACSLSADGILTVEAGEYPMIENGEPVAIYTPMVRLSGAYLYQQADCGLGCRCDATIIKTRQNRAQEHAKAMDAAIEELIGMADSAKLPTLQEHARFLRWLWAKR